MPADPGADLFLGLADINRLTVIIKERIDAPSVRPDGAPASLDWVVKRSCQKRGEIGPKIFGLKRGEVGVVRVAVCHKALGNQRKKITP